MRPQDLFGSYLLLDKIRSDELSTSWRVGELEERRIVRLALLQVFDGPRCDGAAVARSLVANGAAETHLNGPGYASLIEAGKFDGLPFLAYEYVSAFTVMEVLARMVDRSRGAGVDIALLIAERLARSLAAAQSRPDGAGRLLHGCLASSLALVSHDGEVMVTGFSAAAGLRASVARPSTDLSSSIDRYLSPAALGRPEVRPADDVYSLGAILYELITCEPLGHSAERPLDERIDTIGLNAETGEVADAVRSLLRASLGVEAGRFADVSAWGDEVSRIVDDSGHHPTAFNTAFLLHSLFSSEIAQEARAVERDTRLIGTYATSLDLRREPRTVGAAADPAADNPVADTPALDTPALDTPTIANARHEREVPAISAEASVPVVAGSPEPTAEIDGAAQPAAPSGEPSTTLRPEHEGPTATSQPAAAATPTELREDLRRDGSPPRADDPTDGMPPAGMHADEAREAGTGVHTTSAPPPSDYGTRRLSAGELLAAIVDRPAEPAGSQRDGIAATAAAAPISTLASEPMAEASDDPDVRIVDLRSMAQQIEQTPDEEPPVEVAADEWAAAVDAAPAAGSDVDSAIESLELELPQLQRTAASPLYRSRLAAALATIVALGAVAGWLLFGRHDAPEVESAEPVATAIDAASSLNSDRPTELPAPPAGLSVAVVSPHSEPEPPLDPDTETVPLAAVDEQVDSAATHLDALLDERERKLEAELRREYEAELERLRAEVEARERAASSAGQASPTTTAAGPDDASGRTREERLAYTHSPVTATQAHTPK